MSFKSRKQAVIKLLHHYYLYRDLIDTNMKINGKKISETRKLKGLTQEELAEKSKMNLRTIQRIENNESIPRGKSLRLICDVLEISLEDTLISEKQRRVKTIINIFINSIFLIVLNIILMSIIGYLTLDSEANMNSRIGAFLLSFFIPFFIVYKTPHMNGIERMLKFGTGLIAYIIIALLSIKFPATIGTGLIPCLLIALGVLFYGKKLTNPAE
jgi:transcriptional regulator with XRE-family HTH domain